jgi:dipicolinic acid synthetase B subunit
MNKTHVGFALCGSFCTFSQVIPIMKELVDEGLEITPIMSQAAYTTNTRFGDAQEFVNEIESICGKNVIHTIFQAEPIGPKKLLDVLVVEPCTGNTLGKLANGIYDTSVTLAVKAHLRNNRPVVIGVSTNDALCASAPSIGKLMATKNYYFVPYGQDDEIKKPKSMVADFTKILDSEGVFLSSANSINWGRLAPQIVYYVSAYCDLLKSGKIALGEKIDVCVPTGNFGNIFAAYIAKLMGLPIEKLVCASNKNNILTDFLKTGVYDKNRKFYATMSPSMDILISSNLERLLYFVAGAEKTRAYMKSLNETGRYEVDADILSAIKADFSAFYCTEDNCKSTIKNIFDKYSYVCDPHTAVAVYSAQKFVDSEKTGLKNIVASTASPYKFAADVLISLGETVPESNKDILDKLSTQTKTEIPTPLATLFGKEVRFTKSVGRTDSEMLCEVMEFSK